MYVNLIVIALLLIGFLNCGRSRGALRSFLKLNLLRKRLTPRLSMRDRWAPALGYHRMILKDRNTEPFSIECRKTK